MAIKIEQFHVDDVLFNRVYSDEGRYVVRDGIEYEEACDPVSFGRVYTEGRVIHTEEREAEALDLLEILFGEGEPG